MSASKSVQKLVRKKCHSSSHIHCYACKQNVIWKQSIEYVTERKAFFQTVSGCAFSVSKVSERASIVVEVVIRRFPSVSHSKCFYNIRLIALVSRNKVEHEELFRFLKGDADKWNRDICACVKGFYSVFPEHYFNFLLDVLSFVLPKSLTLLRILHTELFEIF
jgi:hypothetical protein